MTQDSPLPSPSDPNLTLAQATPEEKLETWRLNGTEWAGRLPLEAYLRREKHLADQTFTRNGGITFWILVDGRKEPNNREILASCESLRKRALVARAETDGDGDVEEIVSHGIGSVFCNPEYRGKGYASRMLEELATKLDTWQQPYGRQSDFTVLFSDIGKKFYSKAGWNAFASSHIELPGAQDLDDKQEMKPRPIFANDLKQLCAIDEATIIKAGLLQQSSSAGKTTVALIPDWETLEWHHAREEFFAKEMLHMTPDVKGAYVHVKDGPRIWCVWGRFFGTEASGDVFHILRLAVEGEEDLTSTNSGIPNNDDSVDPSDQRIPAIAALFRAAQNEAFKWGMKQVQMWNPSPLAVRAARLIDPSVQIVHRGEESIASLRWHGSEPAENVEWLGNEKYAWC